jgi:hypothetical protein
MNKQNDDRWLECSVNVEKKTKSSYSILFCIGNTYFCYFLFPSFKKTNETLNKKSWNHSDNRLIWREKKEVHKREENLLVDFWRQAIQIGSRCKRNKHTHTEREKKDNCTKFWIWSFWWIWVWNEIHCNSVFLDYGIHRLNKNVYIVELFSWKK